MLGIDGEKKRPDCWKENMTSIENEAPSDVEHKQWYFLSNQYKKREKKLQVRQWTG